MAIQTAERISPYEASDKVIFERSLFAYHQAADIISGTVLEIGTGMGYGLPLLVPRSECFISIDKYPSEMVIRYANDNKIRFIRAKIPPLSEIDDNSIDFIICFQLIEHIKQDRELVREMFRVLKKGGKALLTTPNKQMSLTRNPWHIREYNIREFEILFNEFFSSIEIYGIYGNDKVKEYYLKNKESVRKITRFDIFKLQYHLPRFLLQIPYDLLNRLNRKKLLQQNTGLVSDISYQDFSLKMADDDCYDIFAIAIK